MSENNGKLNLGVLYRFNYENGTKIVGRYRATSPNFYDIWIDETGVLQRIPTAGMFAAEIMPDQITAGRRIDELVAEKVLGWIWVEGTTNGQPWRYLVPAAQKDERGIMVPYFSADKSIADDLASRLYIDDKIGTKFGDELGIQFKPVEDFGKIPVMFEEFSPLQICIAALKAVGHTF